jgi:hypothetical protein
VGVRQIILAFVQMGLTGLVWGAWPITLRESGLKGNVSSAAFSLGVLLIVTPFALRTMGGTLPSANWILVLISVLLGAAGMLMFNNALASSPLEKLPPLFIIMIVVQAAVPATYGMFRDGKLTMDRAIGYGAAFVAAFFLTRGAF